MKPSDGMIASKQGLSVISRPNGFHEHTFPAIDQALTPWPEMAAQAEGIREILESARSTWLKSTAGTGLAINTNCNPK